MIRITELKDVQTEIDISYTVEVKTYNLVTGFMSDECTPFRIAQSAMIWISNNGEIGELECIYPRIVESPPCQLSEHVNHQEGFPEIDITSDDSDVCVQHHEGGYTFWFTKGKVIDSQIHLENITFLLTGTELIGIVCKNVDIV